MGFSLYPEYDLALPLPQATTLLTNILNQEHWTTTVTRDEQNHIDIQAKRQNPQRNPFAIHEVTLKLRQHRNVTTFQYRPHYSVTNTIFLHAALSLTATTLLLTEAKRLPNLAAPLSVTAAAAILFIRIGNRKGTTFIQRLCDNITNQSGHTVTPTRDGISTEPSALGTSIHALTFGLFAFGIGFRRGMLLSKELLPAFILLLAILLYLAAVLPQTKSHHRVHGESPNLIAAVSIFLYCTWPTMRDGQQAIFKHKGPLNDPVAPVIAAICRADCYKLKEALVLGWLCIGAILIIGMLVMAASITHEVTTEKAQQHHTGERLPPQSAYNCLMVPAGLAVWGICTYAQLQGVSWGIRNTIRSNAHVYLGDIIWISILLIAYSAILVREVCTAVTYARAAAKTPQEVIDDCHRLARAMAIDPPRVVSMQVEMSSARRALFYGKVIVLSAKQLETLNHDERDALILHELSHLKMHATLLGALELISSLTLCGRGMLSPLIDTIDMELQADQMAAKALREDGRDGSAILSSMLNAVATGRAVRNLTSSQHADTQFIQQCTHRFPRLTLLARVALGDDVLWYQHPTINERLNALEQSPRCHK